MTRAEETRRGYAAVSEAMKIGQERTALLREVLEAHASRAEETARVHELRAAFAASDEPDVFRWFARRELARDAKRDVRIAAYPSNISSGSVIALRRARDFIAWRSGMGSNSILREMDAAISELVANPQSAAEPPRDRTDFDWDVIGETESF